MNRYTVRLRSVGNPDFRQYAPISEPLNVTRYSLGGIVASCMDYIKRNELGGGNWPTTIVNKNGKKFCSVSYNGRCWNLAKNDAGEILVPFDAYEVHGVRDHERVEDSQATGFSLFGHIAGCGLLCIGDFQTRAEAEAIQFRIENHDL